MIIVFNFLILIGAIQLVRATGKPILSSSIYVGATSLLALLMNWSALVSELGVFAVVVLVKFILISIYFLLLSRFEESIILYLLILALGFVLFIL